MKHKLAYEFRRVNVETVVLIMPSVIRDYGHIMSKTESPSLEKLICYFQHTLM